MLLDDINLTRRTFLTRSVHAGAGAVAAASVARVWAQGAVTSAAPAARAALAPLNLAYAGSINALMMGPLRQAAASSLKLDLNGHGQGADAVAQSIVSGAIQPDIFVSITPGPMLTVLRAGLAQVAEPIARTEMALLYSPAGRFTAQLDAAAKGQAQWWQVMQQPGFRFGRSDPAHDPGGRNIIFTMMLAAKVYQQPELVDKVLGPLNNPAQISKDRSAQVRMQAGELDAISAYRVSVVPSKLPSLMLAPQVNLSDDHIHEEQPGVSISIDGRTYFPEPLVYYAAVLKNATHRAGAESFMQWLKGGQAQEILRTNMYDPAGNASLLRA